MHLHNRPFAAAHVHPCCVADLHVCHPAQHRHTRTLAGRRRVPNRLSARAAAGVGLCGRRGVRHGLGSAAHLARSGPQFAQRRPAQGIGRFRSSVKSSFDERRGVAGTVVRGSGVRGTRGAGLLRHQAAVREHGGGAMPRTAISSPRLHRQRYPAGMSPVGATGRTCLLASPHGARTNAQCWRSNSEGCRVAAAIRCRHARCAWVLPSITPVRLY